MKGKILFGLFVGIYAVVSSAVGVAGETSEFGLISEAEWALGAPDQYPEAKALILFDEGKGSIKNTTLDRHVRIKILSKEGSERAAEIEIPVYRGDKIKNLEAHTILPDGSKFEVKEFFDKTVDEVDVRAFTFPSIQDECIIEYQYRLSRNYYYLPTWYFQNEIYTVRSTYILDFGGYSRFTPIYVNIPILAKEGLADYDKDGGEKTVPFRMEIANLLPVVDEPLVGARLDNLMSVTFINRYAIEGLGWNKIGEWVGEWYESEFYNSQKDIRKVSDSVCSGLESDDEKIARLYDFVTGQILTDNDLDAAGKLSDIMKNHKGRAFEKNLLLVELLKAQNIPARQLMIGSRREHERVNVDIKSLSQFNRSLCYIAHDSAAYVLNPGARCAFFPYPEAGDLAVQGLLVDGEDSRLLDIPHRARTNGTDMASTIYIDGSGNAICSTTIIIKGYSMERWRHKELDSLSDKRIAESLLEDLEYEYEISSAVLMADLAKDRYLFDLVLDLPNFVSVIDSNFFFTPFIMPVEDNPFAGDIRNFPVDFNFTFSNRHQVRVVLPPDMVVTDVPQNIYQTMQDGKFTRKAVTEGNEIAIQSELNIKRASFPTSVYKNVREMFDIMSQSCLDQALAVKVQGEAGEL